MINWKNFPVDVWMAPMSEGVYFLGDSNQNLVYVGRADMLKRRLEQHPDPSNPCLQRKLIRYFDYEITNNSESREQQLIEALNPECNRT